MLGFEEGELLGCGGIDAIDEGSEAGDLLEIWCSVKQISRSYCGRGGNLFPLIPHSHLIPTLVLLLEYFLSQPLRIPIVISPYPPEFNRNTILLQPENQKGDLPEKSLIHYSPPPRRFISGLVPFPNISRKLINHIAHEEGVGIVDCDFGREEKGVGLGEGVSWEIGV